MEVPVVAGRRRGPLGRTLTVVRLVHPFPSLLDAAVVAVVALVAGGPPDRAAVLGLATASVQFSIGTLNDVVDAHDDAATRTGKPIPEGLVSEGVAKAMAASFGLVGLVLAASAGPVLLVVAGIGLAIGLWYDLGAAGTRWSWLPLALGVPLLPVFGWYGATASLPTSFAVLVPAAALAGSALAIANAAVDVERDVSVGSTSLAVALGPRAAGALVLLLEILVGALAVGSASGEGRAGPWLGATAATAAIPVAGALLGVLRARSGPGPREAAFELQAVGLGLLAVAWVNALNAAAA